MKVLFISHMREASGWGQAARDIILAMDSVGIDIVARCVKLGINPPELPTRLLELESKDSEGCNVCIQHVLPHLMDYNGNFDKNIALYDTETDSFTYSSWPDKINSMDEAWVINQQMLESSIASGVKIPIKVVPHCSNLDKFKKDYPKLDIEPLIDEFTFYFIGDLTRRKNLVALIKAYHLEFSPNEQASLLIKAAKHNVSDADNIKEISEACNKIKEQLKLYPKPEDYKPEIIISERLSEDILASLHKTCDCFVAPSFGEAWCIPAFDALGFGNPVIANDVGGLSEFVNNRNGWLVSNTIEPVFGMKDTFHDIFTGRENWNNICVNDLRRCMREAYEDKESFLDKKIKATKSVNKFGYEDVGNYIKELLCH